MRVADETQRVSRERAGRMVLCEGWGAVPLAIPNSFFASGELKK